MSDAEKTGNHDEHDVTENRGSQDRDTENRTVDSGSSSAEESLAGSIDPNSIEGIFLRAVQIEDVPERESFLQQQCRGDEERRRVTALLRAYDDAGSFLETPAGKPKASEERSLDFLQPAGDDCLGLLGPYRVLEVIGSGGMGIVLRALDSKLNRVVAVKVLLPELARHPNARRRFLREAQAAAAISHPHVVTIHAVEESNDSVGPPPPPYLVMECVVGHSLQQKLDTVGPLRLQEILRISRQIAEGLSAAHQQGLIHRDIKPANILLENGVQRVKITDFGLARATDDLSVTMTGEVSGTPQYMSPEQASGRRLDQRSDLFSLGSVMYAMCTGHSPFRAKNLAHVIQRVTQDDPRAITEQNPEIPLWLEQIIRCLLEKEPEHRIQSAEGLVAILDQHLTRLQQPASSGSHSLINHVLPTTAPLSRTRSRRGPESHDATPSSLVSGSPRSNEGGATLASEQTPSQRLGQIVLAFLLALFLGAALSFATISSTMLQMNMQRVEAQLIFALVVTAASAALACIGIYLKHRGEKPTKLRIVQTVMVLGTMLVGYTWATFVRSPGTSVNDYRALGFLTLIWAIFCLYAGKVWSDSYQVEDSLRSSESIHGRVGRYLITGGVFLFVLPLALIAFGLVLSDGDVMEAGGQILFTASVFGSLAIITGYLLRYIIDTAPETHRPLGVWLATMLAISIAMGGSLVHTVVEQRSLETEQAEAVVALVPESPAIAITHPPCQFRLISVNGGGSTRWSLSNTETRLILSPELLGTRIDLYLILEDGREYIRYGLPIESLHNAITISEDDLRDPNRALVEILQDAPGVKLRMVKYPTQKVTKNEFSINSAPFHKLMQPGEHRIVLDFVREEWDVPEDEVQYQTLDYRVLVPNLEPLKLSLREILEEHGDQAKTHRLRWKPDFNPLVPSDNESAAVEAASTPKSSTLDSHVEPSTSPELSTSPEPSTSHEDELND